MKLLKLLSVPIALLMLGGVALAQVSGGIGTQQYFKKTGTNTIEFVKSTYELGANTSRISKIWANNMDVVTLSYGGTATGDIDLAGYDLLNTGLIDFDAGSHHTIQGQDGLLTFKGIGGVKNEDLTISARQVQRVSPTWTSREST